MALEKTVLDLRGLKCPLPVLRARKHLASREQGDVVTVMTTDPLAVIDIPHMCHEDGHDFKMQKTGDAEHQFQITVKQKSGD